MKIIRSLKRIFHSRFLAWMLKGKLENRPFSSSKDFHFQNEKKLSCETDFHWRIKKKALS